MASRAVSSPWQRAAASLIERVGKHAANTIVRTIDESLGELLPTIEDERQRDRLKAVAADVAADHLWMASPKLKHPSFAVAAYLDAVPRDDSSYSVYASCSGVVQRQNARLWTER